jgi:ABC-type dipeptide/oligopeptide/nickel transport system permease component
MGATTYFLNPPIIAAVVVIISGLFLLVDLVVSLGIRAVDPRMRGDEDLARAGGQL